VPHAQPASGRPRWHPLRRWAPPLAAVTAGLLLLLAFPPYGLWWLAPIGVALLAVAVHGRRVRAGLGLGALCGAALFVPLLDWTNLHTGVLPWLLLSAACAAYVAAVGGALAYVGPLLTRWPWTAPPVVGALWVAQEAMRGRTPFGGFPWGRLAFSQGHSPLLAFAAWGGAPLVTFVVALCGGLLALAVTRSWGGPVRRGGSRPGSRFTAGLVALGVLAVVPATAALVPAAQPNGPAVTVAIVQGNVPRLGLDFNAQRRAVLDNHVRGTVELADRVAAGTETQPDLVVWPENASDIDPLANADAAAAIDRAAAAIGAPILVGALLQGSGTGLLNAGLLWVAGQGETQRYVKRHPVPFAEYVPMRRIARLVSDKVDLVRVDFQAGDRPGVLTVGPMTFGDVICFEVAYDNIVRDTVTGGAQLIVVQTNNATFNAAEAAQQGDMVRLRAVEHGRPALMASTVGISSFVDSAGRVSGATRFNTPAVVVRTVQLADGRTLATRIGVGPEWTLVGAALAALAGAGWLRRRRQE